MALSLLVWFLLVISLVNLVGIDLTLEMPARKGLAQAHARMGMMIATGELQNILRHPSPGNRRSFR